MSAPRPTRPVVPVAAVDDVVAVAPADQVVARSAVQRVVAGPAPDAVVVVARVDRVVAPAGPDAVVTAERVDDVVSAARKEALRGIACRSARRHPRAFVRDQSVGGRRADHSCPQERDQSDDDEPGLHVR